MLACGYLAIGLVIGIVLVAHAENRWNVWFEYMHPIGQILCIAVVWGPTAIIGVVAWLLRFD